MISKNKRHSIRRFKKRVNELSSSILIVLILRREGKYYRLYIEIRVSLDYVLD